MQPKPFQIDLRALPIPAPKPAAKPAPKPAPAAAAAAAGPAAAASSGDPPHASQAGHASGVSQAQIQAEGAPKEHPFGLPINVWEQVWSHTPFVPLPEVNNLIAQLDAIGMPAVLDDYQGPAHMDDAQVTSILGQLNALLANINTTWTDARIANLFHKHIPPDAQIRYIRNAKEQLKTVKKLIKDRITKIKDMVDEADAAMHTWDEERQ